MNDLEQQTKQTQDLYRDLEHSILSFMTALSMLKQDEVEFNYDIRAAAVLMGEVTKVSTKAIKVLDDNDRMRKALAELRDRIHEFSEDTIG